MKSSGLGKGYIQIYTGNGKGKTTAALGLSMRAAGHGLHTVIIQFMKGWIDYGELEGVRMLSPYVEIHQAGRDTFVKRGSPDAEDVRLAAEGWEKAKKTIMEGKSDIVILDEINCAVDYGLLPIAEVIDVLKNKPEGMELVLTGRGAPQPLIDIADLVTEMKEVKHYYSEGVDARTGIER